MTTYLTQGVVRNYKAISRKLYDRYAWHQWIWKLFHAPEAKQSHEFQWRIDRKDGSVVVWILSERKPDFTAIKDLDESSERWATKEVSDSFLTHKRYMFALAANPTVMRVVRQEDGTRRKNGRRTAIYDREELKRWLADKGAKAGFALECVDCDPPVSEYFHRRKDERKGAHSLVEFRGVLKVLDKNAFVDAWKLGIGPAKGFGFGLLLLSPLADSQS